MFMLAHLFAGINPRKREEQNRGIERCFPDFSLNQKVLGLEVLDKVNDLRTRPMLC